jgi:ectoine hydroxylase-related dioxygenase (phytanoyl-CoA dioxygenase family)
MTGYDKHTLNREFSWRDRQGPFRLVSDAQASQWNEQGFFLLQHVVSIGIIDRLVSEIDPLEQKAEAFLRTQKDNRLYIARADEITFTTHIVRQSAFVKEFLRSALFVDLCLDLIGDDTRLYWDQAVYKKPGTTREFPWHQDNGYNFVQPQDYVTCWLPMTDVTRENGCPWVAPGIHRQGTLHHWWTEPGFECLKDVSEAVAVEAKAGDVVVFSSLTPHRTGLNQTDNVRKAYIAQYAHDGSTMFPRQGRQNIPQNNAQRQFLITRSGRAAR